MGVGGQCHALAGHFTPGKDLVPIVEEAGWAPGPVWMDAKNLAPTRLYLVLLTVMQGVPNPMSQTSPGYSPPLIKQKSSYQHGSKSE